MGPRSNGGMSHYIAIRRAEVADLESRVSLVGDSIMEYCKEAFLLFLFQEAVWQATVLVGAVLFIFCGVSPWGVALVVPGAALVVLLTVHAQHLAIAHDHKQRVRHECLGFIAEAVESSLLVDPATVKHTLLHDQTEFPTIMRRKVIGTASVCELRGGNGRDMFLGDLAVHPKYRGKGAGGALAAAARAAAAARGSALAAVTSELQSGAALLLHRNRWECRGAYQRRLVGSALTLTLSLHVVDLAHASTA